MSIPRAPRRLATGGMAELYLALHRSIAGLERIVVIKRILPELGQDQNFITMLLQEARIAATFSHPNIVTIFDVGQVEGTYFIAMEHIDGITLQKAARRAWAVGEAVPMEVALRAIADAAREGRMTDAEALHRKLQPLFKGLFVESNPGPVKALLAQLGLIRNELRLPLVPVEPATEQLMAGLIDSLGLTVAGPAARA